MIYVKEKNGEVKIITLTNKNITTMRTKNLFWIQNLTDGSYKVCKWDDESGRWIAVSDSFIYKGNAKRFIERY